MKNIKKVLTTSKLLYAALKKVIEKIVFFWHNLYMEFKVNEVVVHCREGLSTIVGETEIAGNAYFVIVSRKNPKENIYVLKTRTDNIIRPVMNEVEAKEVINYMKTVEAGFISNTKQRRDLYKKKLLSGNVYDLAYLSRQLYFFNYYNSHGQLVKLGPTDLQMLKDAESILFDEFAISFHCDREKVEEVVTQLIV